MTEAKLSRKRGRKAARRKHIRKVRFLQKVEQANLMVKMNMRSTWEEA